MEQSEIEWYGFHFIPSLTTIFLPLQFGQNEHLALFRSKISKQWNWAFVPLRSIPLCSTLFRSVHFMISKHILKEWKMVRELEWIWIISFLSHGVLYIWDLVETIQIWIEGELPSIKPLAGPEHKAKNGIWIFVNHIFQHIKMNLIVQRILKNILQPHEFIS